MTNHSSRRDRRRFLQESMFATVALAGGMDARPSALALGVTPQYRIYSIAGYNIAHIDVTARLCEEHNIRYEDVDRVEAIVNWLETQYPSPAWRVAFEA
jgi:hypothetical protein